MPISLWSTVDSQPMAPGSVAQIRSSLSMSELGGRLFVDQRLAVISGKGHGSYSSVQRLR